jgi:hypothetical protein
LAGLGQFSVSPTVEEGTKGGNKEGNKSQRPWDAFLLSPFPYLILKKRCGSDSTEEKDSNCDNHNNNHEQKDA